MNASETLTLLLIGGGLCIVGFIITSAVALITSARTAGQHIASGMKLTLQPRTATPIDAPRPGISAAVRGDAGSPDPTPAGDVASQQMFSLLREYYAANISQANTIFWAALLSMSVGFAVIFAGIVIASLKATTGGITIAIVTTVAGVLSQFIGATFLVGLRSTQQQATTYAQTLVDLRLRDVRANAEAQSVALGLQLLREVSDNAGSLSNQTRATLATGLILHGPVAAPSATFAAPEPVDTDALPRTAPRIDGRSRIESVSSDAPGTASQPRS